MVLASILGCTADRPSSLSNAQVNPEGWHTPVRLEALVGEADKPYDIDIAVRFDSRVDRTDLTLSYQWLWREIPIDSGTLVIKLIELDDRGQARIPTPIMHKVEACLSNEYKFSHSGLYELQIKPLDISALGISDITLRLNPSTK